MSGRGYSLSIEHWEAHLWHIICGRWADRRCRVCGLKDVGKGIPEQWQVTPGEQGALIR